MAELNYQKLLDEKMAELEREGKVPSLLLHACCAPCSTYTLEYLSRCFEITIYFYNPNIDTEEEYELRLEELNRLIKEMPLRNKVSLISGTYEPERFYKSAEGMETLSEGGARCFYCYSLRISEAAKAAKENNMDYFTTTLSISPHKDAEWINSLGEKYEKEYEIPYLYADFKKNGGFHRSTELSKEYGLYRQDYCGCKFSKTEAEKRKAKK